MSGRAGLKSIFVMPTRADCFGLACIEAMAAGLAVVMGDVGPSSFTSGAAENSPHAVHANSIATTDFIVKQHIHAACRHETLQIQLNRAISMSHGTVPA